MPTIFERIIAGEIPSHRVWEDDRHVAFLDINPRILGHTLVVPKIPVDDVFKLPPDDYAALWAAVRTVSDRLRSRLRVARVCLWVYGFEVPHVHVHLLPMNSLEDIEMPPVDQAAKSSLAETAELLK